MYSCGRYFWLTCRYDDRKLRASSKLDWSLCYRLPLHSWTTGFRKLERLLGNYCFTCIQCIAEILQKSVFQICQIMMKFPSLSKILGSSIVSTAFQLLLPKLFYESRASTLKALRSLRSKYMDVSVPGSCCCCLNGEYGPQIGHRYWIESVWHRGWHCRPSQLFYPVHVAGGLRDRQAWCKWRLLWSFLSFDCCLTHTMVIIARRLQ